MVKKILVANRGEIACRIMRTAHDMGVSCTAIYAEDDAAASHVSRADDSQPLQRRGAAAYLDIDAVLRAAKAADCDAIHPGYGFLSENAAFAMACENAGLDFIGPTHEQLSMFGDKAWARLKARDCDVPLVPGALEAVTLEGARDFFTELPAGASMMIKAVAGGGGRGMRRVDHVKQLDEAYKLCRQEADAAFGVPDVYVEQYVARARHIEVQVVGDGGGDVVHLYERDCTLQRRHQKLIEIAPSPSLPPGLRDRITEAALRMAKEASFRSLGTFEFLVDASDGPLKPGSAFYFMEANPRIQVEHTVTEEVLGLDLVALQIEIAQGRTLKDLGLAQNKIPKPRGVAVQARINMERMTADGEITPTAGRISVFEPPQGRGVRNETAGYAGLLASPNYDSMIAKLVVHSDDADFGRAITRTSRALAEYRIEGVDTNISFLRALLARADVKADEIHTTYVNDHLGALLTEAAAFETAHPARADSSTSASAQRVVDTPEGAAPVNAPMQAMVVTVNCAAGDVVRKGDELVILEAMKMQHVVSAPASGAVALVTISPDELCEADQPLLFITPDEDAETEQAVASAIDLDHIRPDLQEVIDRHAVLEDAQRPEAVAKVHKRGRRTARENVADLCDDDSFVEYGGLIIAAQRGRRSEEDLIQNAPGDGMVAGIGTVNGETFAHASTMVVSYDYMVMAGTQGLMNHHKTDRMFEIAERENLPVVLFAEGGGGRPGDVDSAGVSGLDCMSFYAFGRLSGKVPLVGIGSGRCFAGNAALFGCCDVTIGTADLNVGMGGPAMIEGGGLGKVRPEDIGPIDIQTANGVIDIAVKDDAEAVAAAKQYLSYFQGPLADWTCEDQRNLRHLVPENRLRAYDIRTVIHTLADTDSVLELRAGFGKGMITALARVEGRPIGVIANNPAYMGGAITSDGADKAARFMKLCDVHGLPILFLCDTPGIMVGPEAEKSATVRHAARLMVVGANITTPFFTIVTRKAYGLGAMTMAGGAFPVPMFAVSWPTGEMGPMGLEGAVQLGYRRELEAMTDPAAQKARYDELVAERYKVGKALNVATYLELDDVIDPADSRRWIMMALKAREADQRPRERRQFIDPW